MKLVACTHDRHAKAILDILNDTIVHSTALYDYVPRPPEAMRGWFDAKSAGPYPVIGAENEEGQLLGFASYGPFRGWPAYKYSVENGIYIHKSCRGRGLGRMLMDELITHARLQNYHVIVAAIDMENIASIRLHQSLGFSHSGTLRHAGFKFGRWLDLGLYQLVLDTPFEPRDG